MSILHNNRADKVQINVRGILRFTLFFIYFIIPIVFFKKHRKDADMSSSNEYKLDFNKAEHVHFIGIGGINMSALAEILKRRGFTVTGSDAHSSPLTKHLEEIGIPVSIGQRKENITDDIDTVVYTAAIHPDNPEYKAAVESGKTVISRASMLGQIMKNYRNPAAIAGTHGKTTTTSMCAQIMLQAGLDPTITVGGILPAIDGNIRIGDSDKFITEACEYTNSFLDLFPGTGVILNVDADHLDFFKDLDDIASSFHKFASLIPEDGVLIIGRDTKKFDEVIDGIKCRIVTFGSDERSDYYPGDISFDELGHSHFTCMKDGMALCDIDLNVPGYHNVLNALAAVAVSMEYNISTEDITEGFAQFHGTNRRFEKKGTFGNVTVYDDYAHHPSEITATLTAAKKLGHNRLWVAFQPHTYTRTAALLPEFAKALCLADNIVLADIYAARETNTLGISSDNLREEIEKTGGNAVFIPEFCDIEAYLRENCEDGDIVFTMGAGNINEVGEHLVSGN